MPGSKSPLDRMRELCSALDDTSEKPHFGEVMFCVGKRPFASCGEKSGRWEIVLALEPDHTDVLIDKDPRFTRYPRDKRAVSFDPTELDSWKDLKALVLESYELARAQKAAPKKRATAPKAKTKTRTKRGARSA